MTAAATVSAKAIAPAQVRVYVGNLPYSANEGQLVEFLSRNGFRPLRTVMAREGSGRPIGFGFIELSREEAQRAICVLDGQSFRGRPLKVQHAGPKSRGKKRREGGMSFLASIERKHGGS